MTPTGYCHRSQESATLRDRACSASKHLGNETTGKRQRAGSRGTNVFPQITFPTAMEIGNHR